MRFIRPTVISFFIFCLFLVAILATGCGNDKAQTNVLRSEKSGNALKLKLEISKQKYLVGQDYFAKVSLENLGDKPLTFNKGDIFKVVVLDSDNKVVWPNGSIPGLSGYDPVTIERGKPYSNELIFIINAPGTYKVYGGVASGAVKKVNGTKVLRDAPPKLKTDPITIIVEEPKEKGPIA